MKIILLIAMFVAAISGMYFAGEKDIYSEVVCFSLAILLCITLHDAHSKEK